MNENEIKSYVNTIDSSLNKTRTSRSLMYTIGNYSFYIIKHIDHGKPVLYIEKGDLGTNKLIEKRYYLKDNKLVLYKEIDKISTQTDEFLTQNQVTRYVNSNSSSALNDSIQSEKVILSPNIQIAQLDSMEDALQQRGKYNLVFEGITDYPKAKYLILSRDELNAPRAPILIKSKDDFIQEITMNPSKYRDEKLNVEWQLQDNEVVYSSGKFDKN